MNEMLFRTLAANLPPKEKKLLKELFNLKEATGVDCFEGIEVPPQFADCAGYIKDPDAKAAFIAWAMSVVFPHGMGTLEDIAARLDNKPSGLVPNTADATTELKATYDVAVDEVNKSLRVSEKARPERVWMVTFNVTMLELSDMLLWRLVATVVKFGTMEDGETTVCIQHDAHPAGENMVGLVATSNGETVFLAHPSHDIACGVSRMPIVWTGDPSDAGMNFLNSARDALPRGKTAETGTATGALSVLVDAIVYAAGGRDRARLNRYERWARKMNAVLIKLGMVTSASLAKLAKDKAHAPYVLAVRELLGVGEQDAAAVVWSQKWAGSLGSSGNHFIELNAAREAGPLCEAGVHTHSGSRGLGSVVFQKFMLWTTLAGTPGVASGGLMSAYADATLALDIFAELNRISCGLLVMRAMGRVSSDPDRLIREVGYGVDAVFDTLPGWKATPEKREALATQIRRGLLHNTHKAFRVVHGGVVHVVFIVSKGAVAVSRQYGFAALPLRAGEGVMDVFLHDPDVECEEIPVADAIAMREAGVPVLKDTAVLKRYILFTGHGAGRNGPKSATAAAATFDGLVAFALKMGFPANIGPGSLGDAPEGYKDAAAIAAMVRLDVAGATGDPSKPVAHIVQSWTESSFKEALLHGMTAAWTRWALAVFQAVADAMAAEGEAYVMDYATAFKIGCIDTLIQFQKGWNKAVFPAIVDMATARMRPE